MFFVAALGGLLFGYDGAAINGAVGAIGSHFRAGPATLGLAVSSALIGAAVGMLIGGRIADSRGRLLPMRIAATLVGGIAVGFASIIAPASIAEIAPAKLRGCLARNGSRTGSSPSRFRTYGTGARARIRSYNAFAVPSFEFVLSFVKESNGRELENMSS